MFYKYKKYKQKYINFKNQIGGDCLVSPDDDDDYNVYFMEYMHKNSLIDHPQSKLDCFSTVTTAKFLFDGLKYDSETNVAYIDFNKTFLNINQIWYIIVNNNNYIRKLNDIENIDYLPRNLIQDKDKLAPVFYYTKEQKKYIEKWLMVFKNKLYIAAVNDMDKLFEAGSLQEVYSSDTELKSLIESADTTFKLSEHLYEHQVTNIKTLESERINENITSEKKLDNAFSLLILYTENLILEISKIIKSYGEDIDITSIVKDTDEVKNIRHDADIRDDTKFKKSENFKKFYDICSTNKIFCITELKNILEKEKDGPHKNNINILLEYINNILNHNNIYRTKIRYDYLNDIYKSIWKRIDESAIFDSSKSQELQVRIVTYAYECIVAKYKTDASDLTAAAIEHLEEQKKIATGEHKHVVDKDKSIIEVNPLYKIIDDMHLKLSNLHDRMRFKPVNALKKRKLDSLRTTITSILKKIEYSKKYHATLVDTYNTTCKNILDEQITNSTRYLLVCPFGQS